MIELKPIAIKDISEHKFFIRYYQRGYRWTEQQVCQLLDDIDNFTPREIKDTTPVEKTFYCLQPIVLKNLSSNAIPDRVLEGSWYEVIDGQQRLTTIYLILKYINEFWIGKQKKPMFSIDYETRENSVQFLSNLKFNEDDLTVAIDKNNIDYYHISKAYQAIRDWELSYREKYKEYFSSEKFLDNFLNYSKIIWYEVEQEENSIKLFERLNLGKIPLTNAELTKALFLSTDSFSELATETQRIKHYEIASLWDDIEHKLNEQDRKFWSFITNKKREDFDTKIDLILDLIAGKSASDLDTLHTFLWFLNQSKTPVTDSASSSLSMAWERIDNFYHTLIEWNNDRELYHLIGYLVSSKRIKGYDKPSLNQLVKYAMSHTKDEFTAHINKHIQDSISFGFTEDSVTDLSYDKNKAVLFNLLLLFNVEVYRTSKTIDDFYPFKQHKSNQWSLEHIHAQSSEGLDQTKKEQWIQWLELHLPVLNELKNQPEFEIDPAINKMISESQDYISNNITLSWDRFNTLFEKINKLLSSKNDPNNTQMHGLGNMALLSQPNNSVLNNSAFEVKRRQIIKLDKEGSFIPICTKRVFQGYYSDAGSLEPKYIWSPQDQETYLKEMLDTLSNYIPYDFDNSNNIALLFELNSTTPLSEDDL
ncbi:DUF262 domain-containing protein [Psychrobacter sp. Arc29]|uniref:DUF262 domain-containing protein n=1 Tax=Psychrobacter sp. Arc29 TaxID=3046690 RepID=UPI00352DD4AF